MGFEQRARVCVYARACAYACVCKEVIHILHKYVVSLQNASTPHPTLAITQLQ